MQSISDPDATAPLVAEGEEHCGRIDLAEPVPGALRLPAGHPKHRARVTSGRTGADLAGRH